MRDQRKTKAQLIAELDALRRRAAELEHRLAPRPDRSVPSRDPHAEPPDQTDVFFQSVVEVSPEAMTLTDLSGRITFANEQAARLHGFSAPRDMIGTSVFDLITPAHQPAAADAVRQTLVGGAAGNATIEVELARHDRTTFWAELNVTAVRDAQGIPVAVLGLMRDITAQKRTQQELADTRAVLEAAVSQSSVPMVLLSVPGGVIEIVNPAMRELLGRPDGPSEVGRPLAEIDRSWTMLDAEGQPLRADHLPAVLALQGVSTILNAEMKVRRQDGSVRSVLVNVVPIHNPAGQQIAAFGVAVDITVRQELAEALRASEAKFRAVIEQAGEAIALFDEDFHCMDVNAALERLTAVAREAWLGLTTWEINLRFMPPSQRTPDAEARFKATAQAVMAGQSIGPFEVSIYRPDGEIRTVHMSIFPIQAMQRRLLGCLLIDITDRQRIEEALRQSEQRFRTLIENQGEGLGLVDADENFMFANPAAADVFGVTDGLVGHNLREFVDDEQYTLIKHETQARQRGLKSIYEIAIRRPDGQTRNLIVTAVPQIDDRGRFVGAFGVFRDITARKQAEAALQTAFRRFQIILSSLYGGVLVVNSSDRVEFANQAFCDLFDLDVPPDDLLGLTAPDMLQKIQHVYADPPAALARIQEIVANGRPLRGEEIAMSGNRTYLRDFIPIVIEARSHGRLWHHQDITERKQTEEYIQRLNSELEQRVIERTMELQAANEALQDDIHHRQRIEEMLRRSEQRYRTLFESAGDAIFILDLEGRFIEVNRVACERYGYTLDEMRQLNVAELYPLDQRPQVPPRLAQTRHLGENHFEAMHQRRDGSPIPVDVNSRVIEYGGQPAILGIVRDITERKHTEQTLRRYGTEQTALYNTALLLNAQLDVSALLQLIVEQAASLLSISAGGVYLYDQQRDVLVLAVGLDFYTEYLGAELRPGEGLSGRAFQQRTVLRLDDYQRWDGQAAAYRHESRIHSVIAAPLASTHAVLGVLFVVSNQHRPPFDDHDKQLVELFAANAAVALENAQLYERQQEQYRRLQEAQTRLIQAEKMSALGRLIASISHEINNPLQAVQGCLTLVREGIEEAENLERAAAADWQRDLDVAAAEVQRIAGIVQRLRDFYRPPRSGHQRVDVAAVLDTVLALTAKQLQHSNIAVERVVATDSPLIVNTNADQLKQVILNLVLNAVDAMPEGGRLRVAVAPDMLLRPAGMQAGVRIDLSDNGRGIPADILPHIFEPFFTTKENGSGLGLAISYELVKTLGGDISASSTPEAGATFSIQLPVDTVTDPEVTV